jgi:hypothetical protein
LIWRGRQEKLNYLLGLEPFSLRSPIDEPVDCGYHEPTPKDVADGHGKEVSQKALQIQIDEIASNLAR